MAGKMKTMEEVQKILHYRRSCRMKVCNISTLGSDVRRIEYTCCLAHVLHFVAMRRLKD